MITPQSIDSVLLLGQPKGEQWGCIVEAMKPGAHLLLLSSVKEHHAGTIAAEDNGLEIRDTLAYVFAGSENDVAMQLIAMARKPLQGTVAENTLKWGVGGMNIDRCRIESETRRMCGTTEKSGETSYVLGSRKETYTKEGRWPANLTHDNSPFALALFPKVNKQAKCKTDDKSGWQSEYVGGVVSKPVTRTLYLDDDNGGSAARFFYSAPALNTLCSYLIRLITPTYGTVLTNCDLKGLPNVYNYVKTCEN